MHSSTVKIKTFSWIQRNPGRIPDRSRNDPGRIPEGSRMGSRKDPGRIPEGSPKDPARFKFEFLQ